MVTILVFLFTIVILVVVHELGHFFAAKAFGVKVEEFGVGYPPRAAKLFTWKGTLFSLNWLPFGGFVKIFGEEGSTEVDTSSFAQQKFWKRAVILLGGIAANFLFAVVLYAISFNVGFLTSPDSIPTGSTASEAKILITNVIKNSPASSAGIAAEDTITKLVSGAETVTPASVDEVIVFVRAHADGPIIFTLKHKDVVRDVSVTPRADMTGGKPGVGIELTNAVTARLPLGKAIVKGFSYTWEQTVTIFVTLGQLIGGKSLGGHSIASQLSGPIGIAQVAGQAFAVSFGALLSIMALISVNLAVLNILPFPALDGGRLLIEVFSKNDKSRVPARVIGLINQAGFLLLIVLMLYVTYHDIGRLLGH